MKVLYVLGRGRSGSTIFGNVLGELDGFFCGGEIRFLWDPVVVRSSRGVRIRYEDFVAEPRATVERTRELVGEPAARSPFVDDRTVTLGVNHSIAGNPSRFSTGTLVLEDRSDWREGQSRFDRWVTTAVAWPFLHRYGYAPKRRPA